MGKNILNFLKSKKTLNYFRHYDEIRSSPYFDEEFYRKTYSDHIKNQDPLTHYLLSGYRNSFYPSPDFDGNIYLERYPDLKEQDINPLFHFIAYGKNEGKIAQKPFFITRKEEIIRTNEALLNNFKFDRQPLVSIIILNLNGLEHLKRLFMDFDTKTGYSNYEIIVVDNNSTDDSVNYLKSLDLPIRIMENDRNESFSKSNNMAAEMDEGEYLLLLNNDIEPTYGWLNEMMGVILNTDNAGAVGSKLLFPFYPDNPEKSFTLQHSGDIFAERMYPCCSYAVNDSDNKSTDTAKVIAVTGAVMLVKKEIYERLGGLDESYDYGLEDVDFCLRLYEGGYDTYYCGTSLLFHPESSTRVKSADYVEKDRRNYRIFTDKWADFLSGKLLLDKIQKRKFFTRKDLKVIIINSNKINDFEVRKLAENYVEEGYEVEVIADLEDIYIGSSTDILVNFSKDYSYDDMVCRDDLVCIEVDEDNIELINFKNREVILQEPVESLKDFKFIEDNLKSNDGFLWDLKKH